MRPKQQFLIKRNLYKFQIIKNKIFFFFLLDRGSNLGNLEIWLKIRPHVQPPVTPELIRIVSSDWLLRLLRLFPSRNQTYCVILRVIDLNRFDSQVPLKGTLARRSLLLPSTLVIGTSIKFKGEKYHSKGTGY